MFKELLEKFDDLHSLGNFFHRMEDMVDSLPKDKDVLIDEICSHLQSLKGK